VDETDPEVHEEADYYDEEEELEEEVVVVDNNIVIPTEIKKEPEIVTPSLSLRERSRILREEMQKVEATIRDPVARFKALRELAQKHREATTDFEKLSKPTKVERNLQSSKLDRYIYISAILFCFYIQ